MSESHRTPTRLRGARAATAPRPEPRRLRSALRVRSRSGGLPERRAAPASGNEMLRLPGRRPLLEQLEAAAHDSPEDPAAQARLARAAHWLGQPEQAETAARRAAELAPEEPEYALLEGELSAEAGELAAAAEHLRRAVRLAEGAAPETPRADLGDQARRLLGLVGLSQRFLERAGADGAGAAGGAVKKSRGRGDRARAANVAGVAHLMRGELAPAAEAFRKALAADERNLPAALNLGFLYTLDEPGSERVRRSPGPLLAALRHHPGAARLALHLGELYEAGGLYEAALGQYREAFRREPEALETYDLAGRHAILFPESADALRELLADRAVAAEFRVRRTPEAGEPYFAHGLAELAAARFESAAGDAAAAREALLAARAAFEQGLERAPETPETALLRRHYAAVLERLDEDAPALAEFRRAADEARGAPAAWRARFDLAAALLRRGAVREAVAEFEAAAALNPEEATLAQGLRYAFEAAFALELETERFARTPEAGQDSRALYRLGLAHLAALQGEPALARLDAALALRPDFAAAANARGRALQRLGRTDEAAAAFRRALALDPEYEEARRNLVTLRLLQPGGLDEATRAELDRLGGDDE